MQSLIVLVLFLGSVARAGTLSKDLDGAISRYVESDAFSGTIAIQHKGELIFAKGYGNAVIEFNIPNRPDTKFRIGSLTKQFTAAGIMVLHQAGEMSIDKPVSQYLDGTPSGWSSISVRQLLAHSSGLVRDVPIAVSDFSVFHPLENLLKSAFATDLRFRPGERADYSNAGYTILAALIEKISGTSFGAFMRAKILSKAGLDNTGVDHDSLIVPGRAKGYVFDPKKNKLSSACCFDISNVAGAGDMYSSALDLLKWDLALNGSQVLTDESRAMIFSAQTKLPSGASYGFGWIIEKWNGQNLFWHDGSINGYASNFSRFPESDLAIVILSNRSGGGYLTRLRNDLAKRVLEP